MLSNKIDRTHGEDIEDSVQVPSPCDDCIFVVLRVEGSGDGVSFALCGDLGLSPSHGSVIGTLVNGLLCIYIGSATEAVSWAIASNTDWLS